MIIRNKEKREELKEKLLKLLKEEHAFWSYDENSISLSSVTDDQLIAWTMRYLDLDEIKILFQLYSKEKIKSAWKRLLVPEGDYLHTLNRFFAWYYFNSKRPNAYLKFLETLRLNKVAN